MANVRDSVVDGAVTSRSLVAGLGAGAQCRTPALDHVRNRNVGLG